MTRRTPHLLKTSVQGMISLAQHQTGIAGERYELMMAHFGLTQGPTVEKSILCRILDGRELEGICPIDVAILTPDERAHYQSTIREHHALALAVRTRAELRRMLARETGMPPQKVPILQDTHGKPYCPPLTAQGLDFSVSRSEECAILALGEAGGIGVDVESLIEEDPSDEHLEIVFDDAEYRAWAHLSPNQRRLAFTQAWTIKESFLKAIGTGLDGSPHEVKVHFDDLGQAWPDFPSSAWIFERIHFCPFHTASLIAVMTTP